MWKGSKALLVAQSKSGKTTITLNFVRSVVEGVPFLGWLPVERLKDGERLMLLDFELPPDLLHEWIQTIGIRRKGVFSALSMSGQATNFNIMQPGIRRDWVNKLLDMNVKILAIDCVSEIFAALSLDEQLKKDVDRFLYPLKQLCIDARLENCWLVHHAGHSNEWGRGSSQFGGWPDITITFKIRGPKEGNERSIKAFGRNVSLSRQTVKYDPATHHLTVEHATPEAAEAAAKTAKLSATLKVINKIIDVLRESKEPLSANELMLKIGKHSKDTFYAACKAGSEFSELGTRCF